MTDLFHDKAQDWDSRPVPAQISSGVSAAILEALDLSGDETVMDFGAGTGLVSGHLAPHVGRILAVDVSQGMLAKLAEKPALQGKVEVFCQDILDEPLDRKVDLVVSAMAMHHVEDTAKLAQTLFDHLAPGGRVALADLDAEDGDFHPPGTEGVFHAGFEREALRAHLERAGFADVDFVTACTVDRDDKRYPVFLVTASRAA